MNALLVNDLFNLLLLNGLRLTLIYLWTYIRRLIYVALKQKHRKLCFI